MENSNFHNCVMSDLIGKTVTALAISDDQSILVVSHNQGQSTYQTWADCCAETWIADVVGVSSLIGQTVVHVEDVDLPDVDDGRTRQESDSFYGIKLRTTGGYVSIAYRCSSNGYYGGSLERVESHRLPKGCVLKPITEDYSA